MDPSPDTKSDEEVSVETEPQQQGDAAPLAGEGEAQQGQPEAQEPLLTGDEQEAQGSPEEHLMPQEDPKAPGEEASDPVLVSSTDEPVVISSTSEEVIKSQRPSETAVAKPATEEEQKERESPTWAEKMDQQDVDQTKTAQSGEEDEGRSPSLTQATEGEVRGPTKPAPTEASGTASGEETELDYSFDPSDVEEITMEQEDALLEDDAAAPPSCAVADVEMSAIDSDVPHLPFSGTAVSAHLIKSTIPEGVLSDVQEKISAGEATAVTGERAPVYMLTEQQMRGPGQDDMLDNLGGPSAEGLMNVMMTSMNQQLSSGVKTGPRLYMANTEEENTYLINLAMQARAPETEKPAYGEGPEMQVPEGPERERVFQRVQQEHSMQIPLVESGGSAVPELGEDMAVTSEAMAEDPGLVDAARQIDGESLAAQVKQLSLNQGKTTAPEVTAFTLAHKSEINRVAQSPVIKPTPGIDPAMRVLSVPTTPARGEQELTGQKVLTPREGIATSVLGTRDVPFEVAKELIVDTGPVELLQYMAKEPTFPAMRSEPLTQAMRRLQDQYIIRDLKKWGEEGTSITKTGEVEHRPPPIYIYNVDEPKPELPRWRSHEHQSEQLRWLANKMPVHLFSGIQRHFNNPQLYDPEVTKVAIAGETVERGKKLVVPEKPRAWECALETFRLQRDLPEGAERNAAVEKAIGEEVEAWLGMVKEDGLDAVFKEHQWDELEGKECIVMSNDTLVKRFTRFKTAPTPPFFKLALPGKHYYVLPAPPKARCSIQDLQECMLAPLLYKWPPNFHPGGPWLRPCSWDAYGHMYPAYMQIWAMSVWGPRVILDEPVTDIGGIPQWIMDLHLIKCAHLALWNHVGLELVHSGLRANPGACEAAEIYNWIDLSQFTRFDPTGKTDEEIAQWTKSGRRCYELNLRQLPKLGTIYLAKEYCPEDELLEATVPRLPPFKLAVKGQVTKMPEGDRPVGAKKEPRGYAVFIKKTPPSEDSHAATPATVEWKKRKMRRPSTTPIAGRTRQKTGEKKRKEEERVSRDPQKKRPGQKRARTASGGPSVSTDGRKPSQQAKSESQSSVKTHPASESAKSGPQKPVRDLDRIPKKGPSAGRGKPGKKGTIPASQPRGLYSREWNEADARKLTKRAPGDVKRPPAGYVERASGLSAEEVEEYRDPPEVAARRFDWEDNARGHVRCPIPRGKKDEIRLPSRDPKKKELYTGRFIWDLDDPEPSARQVVVMPPNYNPGSTDRRNRANHYTETEEEWERLVEEACADFDLRHMIGGVDYKTVPWLWEWVATLCRRRGDLIVDEPPPSHPRRQAADRKEPSKKVVPAPSTQEGQEEEEMEITVHAEETDTDSEPGTSEPKEKKKAADETPATGEVVPEPPSVPGYVSWDDDTDAEKEKPELPTKKDAAASTARAGPNFCNRHWSLWPKEPEYHEGEDVRGVLTQEEQRQNSTMQWLQDSHAYRERIKKWNSWNRRDVKEAQAKLHGTPRGKKKTAARTPAEVQAEKLIKTGSRYECKFAGCPVKQPRKGGKEVKKNFTFSELMSHIAGKHLEWDWKCPCPLAPCFDRTRENNRHTLYTAEELFTHISSVHRSQLIQDQGLGVEGTSSSYSTTARTLVANHWFLFKRRYKRVKDLLPVAPGPDCPGRDQWTEEMPRDEWLKICLPTDVRPEDARDQALVAVRMGFASSASGISACIGHLGRNSLRVPPRRTREQRPPSSGPTASQTGRESRRDRDRSRPRRRRKRSRKHRGHGSSSRSRTRPASKAARDEHGQKDDRSRSTAKKDEAAEGARSPSPVFYDGEEGYEPCKQDKKRIIRQAKRTLKDAAKAKAKAEAEQARKEKQQRRRDAKKKPLNERKVGFYDQDDEAEDWNEENEGPRCIDARQAAIGAGTTPLPGRHVPISSDESDAESGSEGSESSTQYPRDTVVVRAGPSERRSVTMTGGKDGKVTLQAHLDSSKHLCGQEFKKPTPTGPDANPFDFIAQSPHRFAAPRSNPRPEALVRTITTTESSKSRTIRKLAEDTLAQFEDAEEEPIQFGDFEDLQLPSGLLDVIQAATLKVRISQDDKERAETVATQVADEMAAAKDEGKGKATGTRQGKGASTRPKHSRKSTPADMGSSQPAGPGPRTKSEQQALIRKKAESARILESTNRAIGLSEEDLEELTMEDLRIYWGRRLYWWEKHDRKATPSMRRGIEEMMDRGERAAAARHIGLMETATRRERDERYAREKAEKARQAEEQQAAEKEAREKERSPTPPREQAVIPPPEDAAPPRTEKGTLTSEDEEDASGPDVIVEDEYETCSTESEKEGEGEEGGPLSGPSSKATPLTEALKKLELDQAEDLETLKTAKEPMEIDLSEESSPSVSPPPAPQDERKKLVGKRRKPEAQQEEDKKKEDKKKEDKKKEDKKKEDKKKEDKKKEEKRKDKQKKDDVPPRESPVVARKEVEVLQKGPLPTVPEGQEVEFGTEPSVKEKYKKRNAPRERQPPRQPDPGYVTPASLFKPPTSFRAPTYSGLPPDTPREVGPTISFSLLKQKTGVTTVDKRKSSSGPRPMSSTLGMGGSPMSSTLGMGGGQPAPRPGPLVSETTCGGQSANGTFAEPPPLGRTRIELPLHPPGISGPSGSQPQLFPPSHYTGGSVASSTTSMRSSVSTSPRYGEPLVLGDVATHATQVATGAVAVLRDQESASPDNRALLPTNRGLPWVTRQNEQQLTNRCAALKDASIKAMQAEDSLRHIAEGIHKNAPVGTEVQLESWKDGGSLPTLPHLPAYPKEPSTSHVQYGATVNIKDSWENKRYQSYIQQKDREYCTLNTTGGMKWPNSHKATASKFRQMATEYVSAIHDLTFYKEYALQKAEEKEQEERQQREQYLREYKAASEARMNELYGRWHTLNSLLQQLGTWAEAQTSQSARVLQSWSDAVCQLSHLQQAFMRDPQGLTTPQELVLVQRASSHLQTIANAVHNRHPVDGTNLTDREPEVATDIDNAVQMVRAMFDAALATAQAAQSPPPPPTTQ